MATRFDTESEVATYTFPDGTANRVSWERGNKASGNGSLRMDILNTDRAASGSWVRYLADDQREFQSNDVFYVQFRQYFPAYFANHAFSGDQFGGPFAGGWKQMIISNMRGSNQLFEVVLQNTNHRSLIQGYNRDSDGSYLGWEDQISTPCNGADFVYQNQINRGGLTNTCLGARRNLGGLFSYGSNKGGPDPETGAFIFYPDEWLTFQIMVRVGSFGAGSNVRDTNIKVWASRQSDSDYTLLIDQQVNLGREVDSTGSPYYFDAIWLLPYNTLKAPDPSAESTYTLYDELIISTNFIPPPSSGAVESPARPAAVTDLMVN